MSGALVLVPSLLGGRAPDDVLPARTLAAARAIEHWVVETPKAARAFLKAIGHPGPIASLSIRELPERPDAAMLDALLAPARAGHAIGVLSDAGAPAVADPGAALVAAAHAARIRVVPLVGPSAILLALMASGMNGQRFAFHGYLPVKADARGDALRALERDSRADARTQLFIETPYRNVAMLDAIARVLDAKTRVCIAADLTLDTERIECHAAATWRNGDQAYYERRPAIFLLQA
jgi:16S rRNA (cytidine1402-2'-O)-methyltransferase